ncbi:MAG: Flp pilus assembly complex ATPase component TadA [Planctomycetales bacterium]|nr:Flp pilus assembly complex ATPase component TadA [Planctomycetales bacterium]
MSQNPSSPPSAMHSYQATAPSRPLRRLLGEQLVGANLLSAEELEQALQIQSQNGSRIGEVLLDLGLVSEEALLPFVADQFDVPPARLREGLIDPACIKLLSPEYQKARLVLPLFKVRGELTVAMSDPDDLPLIDELESITGLTIRPAFAFRAALERLQRRVLDSDFQVDEVTADLDAAAVELNGDLANVELAAVEDLVDGSPVINLVNYLILQAVKKQASDIHVEPGKRCSIVRFRVDGQLIEAVKPRRDIHAAIVSRIKVMGRMDIAEHRMPQDGRCQVLVEGKEIDLRISTIPTVLGEKVVMRVLDRRRLTFNLDELGIPNRTLGGLKEALARPHGLVLVTGPTGSGKTTTLYSAIELIKSVHRNIVTVEDPVEYQLELVNQVQIDSHRDLSFDQALRSILRQDPDVIMVGEIRDSETAKVAVQAALTGHLVLSTLHTNDSAGAVTRLVDMGVEPYKVASALVGVLAQRLVRKVCPKCRTSYYPSIELLDSLHYTGDRSRTFVKGEGCKSCYDTGYQGRIGIYEIMLADQHLRELIAREASVEMVRRWFKNQGGESLLDCGLHLAEREITSLDEVSRVAFAE